MSWAMQFKRVIYVGFSLLFHNFFLMLFNNFTFVELGTMLQEISEPLSIFEVYISTEDLLCSVNLLT